MKSLQLLRRNLSMHGYTEGVESSTLTLKLSMVSPMMKIDLNHLNKSKAARGAVAPAIC